MNGYKIHFEDELYHHGILNQRWGIRRFQNKDGSLTPEGRLRYSKSHGKKNAFKIAKQRKKEKDREEKRVAKEAVKELRTQKKGHSPDYKKPITEYTNEELAAVNERLKMEQAYYQYLKDVAPKRVSAGQKLVKALSTSADVLGSVSKGYSNVKSIIDTTHNIKKSFEDASDRAKEREKKAQEEAKKEAEREKNATKKASKQTKKEEKTKTKTVKAEVYKEPKKKKKNTNAGTTYWSYTPNSGSAHGVKAQPWGHTPSYYPALPYSKIPKKRYW